MHNEEAQRPFLRPVNLVLYFNVELNDIDHILAFGLERSCETFSYPIT
jgi:hypothetical protein